MDKFSLTLTALPPELLEKIFLHLSHDLRCLRNLAEVCTTFHQVICRVPVKVQIPLCDSDLSWLQQHNIPVRHLANREIAAFVGDQILGLNLGLCRVARLVGYDYQSRRCEVTPHYLALLHCLARRATTSLRRLELNVDLIRSRRSFRFTEILASFRNLCSLSIHFSAHIELNQRILNSDDAQKFLDQVLANLTSLTTLHIFICPSRRLRLSSPSLKELGVYKSDGVEVARFHLPALERLSLHGSTADLFRKILADRETGGQAMHRNLLAVVYDGCPKLRVLNNLQLSSILVGPGRPGRREWAGQVNRALVRQYRRQLLAGEATLA